MRYHFAPADARNELQGVQFCETYCQDGCRAGGRARECRLYREPDIHRANVEAWVLFCEHSNQWLAGGMGGAYALNYEFFVRLLQLRGKSDAEIADALERLAVIERAYLTDVIGESRRIDERRREFEQQHQAAGGKTRRGKR